MKNNTKNICLSGLFIAFVTISTMVLRIPVSATSGYIHLGDSFILLIGVFFGWKYGMVAGGLGSMLADILSGYSHWALFTLIIKGLMGFVAGKIGNANKISGFRNVLAAFVTEVVMVLGYLFGGTILKSSFLVALQSVPANIIQGIGGIAIFMVVGFALQKVNIMKYIHG